MQCITGTACGTPPDLMCRDCSTDFVQVYVMLYLFTDEGARQSNNGPEENATAQDDLSVEAVAQVTEDGSCHHETADEDCKKNPEKRKCY